MMGARMLPKTPPFRMYRNAMKDSCKRCELCVALRCRSGPPYACEAGSFGCRRLAIRPDQLTGAFGRLSCGRIRRPMRASGQGYSKRSAGDLFGASDGRLPYAVHSHACRFIEKRPWLVQAEIWGTDGRAEGPGVPSAAVTAAPTVAGPVEGMAQYVALSEPTGGTKSSPTQ